MTYAHTPECNTVHDGPENCPPAVPMTTGPIAVGIQHLGPIYEQLSSIHARLTAIEMMLERLTPLVEYAENFLNNSPTKRFRDALKR